MHRQTPSNQDSVHSFIAMYSISHNFNKLAPPFESCVPGNLGMDSSFSQAKAGQVHTQIMRPREFSELFLFWKKYCAQYFLLVVQFCKKKNISMCLRGPCEPPSILLALFSQDHMRVCIGKKEKIALWVHYGDPGESRDQEICSSCWSFPFLRGIWTLEG